MSPSQNTGIETPMLAKIIVATSAALLWRIAEMTPSGMPTSSAMSSAAIDSSIVIGSRSTRICETGREKRIESPKSP